MRAKLRINFATKPAQTFAFLMKSCILQQALKLGRDAESKPEAGKISQHESGAAEKMWGNLLIKTCATKGAGSGGAGWQMDSAEGRVPERLSWKASSPAIRKVNLYFTIHVLGWSVQWWGWSQKHLLSSASPCPRHTTARAMQTQHQDNPCSAHRPLSARVASLYSWSWCLLSDVAALALKKKKKKVSKTTKILLQQFRKT